MPRPFFRTAAAVSAITAVIGAAPVAALAQTWEPAKPIEFVVPAGTVGGADQMARFIQGVAAKHSLTKQPIIVVNKSGGAGAEGFLAMKSANADPHKIVITLSNLFTTPLATGVPFNWRDLTPVTMLALDQFVLWVNEESPHKTAKAYFEAMKLSPPATFKMGGTGSKQEDQIIAVMMEKAAGKKMTYIPFKGGGDVAVQLVGKHIDATVNNPIEAESHWRAGKLRPLCVFDKEPLPYKGKLTETQSWNDVPTCVSQGIAVEYLMLRGIFMPAGVQPAQVAFYEQLMERVRATPEWQELMQQGAFNTTALSGEPFRAWLTNEEQRHRTLMQEAGFLAAQ